MDDDSLPLLTKYDDARKIFSDVFKKAKKNIVLEDEEDFLDELSDYLIGTHGLSEENARQYAQTVYDIWEECGCSLTAFDRQIGEYRKTLFLKKDEQP